MKKTTPASVPVLSKTIQVINPFAVWHKIITGISLFFLISIFGGNLYAQSDSSAIFDVASQHKGVLLPRISLTSTVDTTTIRSAAISLLIYNTDTAGVSPNNVLPGFYYWTGLTWNPLEKNNITTFAEFYALMPGDNSATVAAGSPVEFPQDGPSNGIVTRTSATQFNIPAIGIYLVHWQVSVEEAGQLILQINGSDIASSVVGRATGTSQIVGNTMITTTETNSVLRVVNPSGNPVALTITPTAGGTRAVSANLVITRVQ